MKRIVNYINEKLHVTSKSFYTCQPKTRDELQQIIIKRINEDGLECNLNDIDVSKIEDMGYLFNAAAYDVFNEFNGDISLWNVSNVKDMRGMFNRCEKFNCDLSKWDVSNVINMDLMFDGCENFRQNLDQWDVSNVKDMNYAFFNCPTTPKWYDKNTCES